MPLTLEQRRDIRNMLEKRLAALQAELDADREKAADSLSAAALVGEEDDRRVAMREAGIATAEASRDKMELDAVRQALARLNSGDYGTCISCGKEIPWARLSTEPSASRCVACQEAFEKR